MKTFDIAIVGAGVIGASAAFELAGEKLRVAVFDRQEPGREASWAAAGMLSPAPDSPRDIPLAPLGRESLKLYPEFVAAIEEGSCRPTGYSREGTFEVFAGPEAEAERDRRVEECRRLGIAAESVPMETGRSRERGIGPAARAAMCLQDEGTVEPRLLTDAVVAAAGNRGAAFHANCEVTSLLVEGERCTGLVAGGERIAAGKVVLAAGCFSAGIGSESEIVRQYAPTRPVRGQMMALRPDRPLLEHVLRSTKGYLVPRRDGRIIAGSTSEEAGFEKRVTPGGLRKILDNALELLPELAGAEIVETWSGLRPGTPDDLPIIGPTDVDGLIVATGHYRNGILLAAVTARLVREWVTAGRTSFDAAPFSPLRFGARKLRAQHAR